MNSQWQVSGGPQGIPEGEEMSSFGDHLIQAMTEALAHAKGEGPAIVHTARCTARGTGTGAADTGTNGTADGHEPVWVPQVGTRAAPCQRAGGDPTAIDPERAGRGETRAAVVMPIFE